MTHISDSTVLITGAASGIGRLMATRMADLGASLILWDRNAIELTCLEQALTKGGHQVKAQSLDLRDREAIDTALGELALLNTDIDILVNNAGIVSGRRVEELADDDVEDVFRINAIVPIILTRRLLPNMVARGSGHIVNIASAAGLVGSPRLSVYSATKAALIAFDEALRLELREYPNGGIKTTIVCPYFIDTGMFSGVRTRWPLLLPILHKEDVADRIVAAITNDRVRVMIPRFVMFSYLLRPLPVAAFDWLASFFGITEAMKTFTKRRDDRNEQRET